MGDFKWLVLEAYRQKWLTNEQLKLLQKNAGRSENELREHLKTFGIHEEQIQQLAEKRNQKKILPSATTLLPAATASVVSSPISTPEKEAPTKIDAREESRIQTHAFHFEALLEDIAGVKQSAGTFLGERYELKEFLGEGGMGEVYKGYDEKLARYVALKFLKLGSLNQKQRERFFKEARALGKLNHPHIVQIYDMGEFKAGERSKFYVVMELVEGKTLSDRLNGQPMSSRAAAELAKKIASALVHVHEHHLIHLDIKPSNIMMIGDEPKLMDFGLAKQIGAEVSVSRVGGTPQYMSPEQCDEAQYSGIGPQTDVYLLGGTLYEMLTGKPPFLGASEGEIVRKVLQEEPNRICSLQKEVHPDLEAICLKALEKKKNARYATAKEFLEELDNFLNYRTIKARRPTPLTILKKWFLRNKKVGIFVLLMFLSIFAEVGYLILENRWREEAELQAREERYQGYMREARKSYQIATTLEGEDRKERGQRIQILLNGFKNIMKALYQKRLEREAEEEKIVVGSKLIEESLKNQDYQLAQFIAEELQIISYLSPEEKTTWLKQVKEEQERSQKEHLKQLESWLLKVKPNTTKEWNPLEEEEIDEFVYEVSKMMDEAVFQRVLAEFNTTATIMIETPIEKRSIHDENYIHILLEILERMDRQIAAKDIFEALKKMVDKVTNSYSFQSVPENELEFMIALFRSLGRLKAYSYGRDLEKIRIDMGVTNLFGIRTTATFKKFLAENIRYYTQEMTNTPQEPNLYISRGEAKYAQEDWSGAIQDFTEALIFLKKQPPPENHVVYNTYNSRGLARWRAGEIENAIQDFTEAITLSPESATFYNNRGLMKQQLNDYPGAIEDYTKAISYYAEHPIYYNNRGNARLEQADVEGAIEDFSEAIRLNPQNPDGYQNRGGAYLYLGETDLAILDFSTAIRLNPQEELYYYSRGDAKYSKNELNSALEDITVAIRLNSQYSDAYHKRGQIKYYQEEYESALVDFNEALRLSPENSEYYHSRALLKNHLGKTQEALDDFNSAIQFNPNASESYYQRALIKKELQDDAGVLADLNETIRFAPEEASYYHSRGEFKEYLQDFDGALEDYNKAIQFDSESTSTYLNRLLLQKKQNRLTEALADCEELIRLYPEWGEGYFQRSLVHLRQNNFSTAEEDYIKAISLLAENPENAENRKIAWFGALEEHLKTQQTQKQKVSFEATLQLLKKYLPEADFNRISVENVWQD